MRSFLADLTDVEILAKYPNTEWWKPVQIVDGGRLVGYLCDLCSLRDQQACEWYLTEAEVLKHVEEVHAKNLTPPIVG